MARMTDDALLALVRSRIAASVNYMDTTFSVNRAEALRFYRGDPQGDEEEGMSQVISRDFMEAVEGALPGLMRPFVSADEVVSFEPQGDEDEAVAKQVTSYINYLFTRRNDAFRFIHDTMKDGLMFRLGIAKVVREEYTDEREDRYHGLDQFGLQALAMDPDVEITAVYDDMERPGLLCAETKTSKTKGRICFIPVANDEFLFERQLASLDVATFLAHRARKTIADLIDMGLDPKDCLNLPQGDTQDFALERIERFEDQAGTWGADDDADPLTRHVWVYECYVRCDYSGKKRVAEWRRVIVANSTILLNEPADGHPFACWTPIPIPHRLAGMSYFDITRDIQLIKTQLQREQLNNIYLSNRPQTEVVEGQVNIDDLLTPRVGGVIRVKQPGQMNTRVTPFTAGASGGLIEYHDTVREARTGVTRYNQGMDANSLNKTATGINIITNASQQRQELVARQYAEFLKDIFKLALQLVCKFPDDASVIRLTNKEYIQVNPREWATEYDMNVTVGLGTGDKQQQASMLTNLLGIQREIIQLQGGAQGPLVDLPNVYQTISRLIEAMGLKGADKYISDPAKATPPAPQPNPELQKLQAQHEMDGQKANLDAAVRVAVAKIAAESAENRALMDNRTKLILAHMRADLALPAPPITEDLSQELQETQPGEAQQDALQALSGSPDSDAMPMVGGGMPPMPENAPSGPPGVMQAGQSLDGFEPHGQ